MTIKAKLITNALLTAVIIVAISMTSFFSMQFLQKKLSHLTQKSTPFQVRTIELQRELQSCISTLIKVNAARTIPEYMGSRAEAEKALAGVLNKQNKLKQLSNSTPDVSTVLDKIARELLVASEERINNSNAAADANANVLQSMKESSARLNGLDSNTRTLQANYSRAFAAALENTGTLSGKLRSIEDLRNLVRELQLITVAVQNASNSSAILIAKGKLKAVAGRIAKNEYYKSNKSISVVANGFVDSLAEYIRIQSVAIAQKNINSKGREEESGKELSYKLNDLFQTLDQETMLAGDELALANSRQGGIFAQSNSASDILTANSELVVLGLMVTDHTNRLFAVDSLPELGKLDTELRDLFMKVNERERMLEISLTKLNAGTELKMLRDVIASLAGIRKEIFSDAGIVNTLKNKINAIEQANKSADKLHALIIQQSAKGNESISAAQGDQERAVAEVNTVFRRSLTQISAIGFSAIFIGILFGFWIYRSVLIPVRLVLKAIRSQQEQVREKAKLAEAVAGGDLNREVIVSEVMTLDKAQARHSEMGMVLRAIVSMSEAQVTLDRALAAMTASLRISRDEEARRDRLKSGLYELNKILRGEHTISKLADAALAFIADFLGAGAGIMYLYFEKGEMLQTLSTYAISRSERLNWGFRLGEGVPGQVALERKVICLDSVPADYLPITSAVGKADPEFVTVMPIMHNDALAGVLELGSFRRFSDDDFDFLHQALEGIAIAIKVNRSRLLVNDLLAQAHQQTEELRVQQEELQQTNEELTERARILAEQKNYNIY